MFYTKTLNNGLRIVGEPMPHYRSFSVGLWVNAGSMWEDADNSGISHFIEHMAFKGTTHYTTKQMAEAMDRIGGLVNAFTDRECTCYYGKTLYRDAEKLFDILSDMATAPLYLSEEMEKERGVVLEEIDMAEDTPEDVAQDLLMEAMYGTCPLARPILGNKKNIRSFNADAIRAYRSRRYRPGECVLSVAGCFNWEEVVEMAEHYLGGFVSAPHDARAQEKNDIGFKRLFRKKPIEQTHLCVGWRGVGLSDPDLYAMNALSGIFGGATSSRLFQRIREDRGLVYSVYSDCASYTDTGILNVYAAFSPDDSEEVHDILMRETEKLAREGVTRKEFDAVIVQLENGIVIGGESTSARMQANGRRLLLEGTLLDEDGLLRKLREVKLDQVNDLASRLLTGEYAQAVVGRKDVP